MATATTTTTATTPPRLDPPRTSEDIQILAFQGNPECRPAVALVFVTRVKLPIFPKVIITDQVFRFTADRTLNCHFFLRFMLQFQMKLFFQPYNPGD